MISFNEAYRLTLDSIQPLGAESVELIAAVGRIAAGDCPARVDSPSLDVSLKDGYAVHASDIAAASPPAPVTLRLAGSVAAGGAWQGALLSGQALRILSGAPLPDGADAVVSEEFTQAPPAPLDGTAHAGAVVVTAHAETGRNVLRCGADVRRGQVIATAGRQLHPTTIGLLAAGGYADVTVTRLPQVAILATGDEVLAPGQPLIAGKLYASNLFTLAAWCRRYGFAVAPQVLPDDERCIRQAIVACLEHCDALLISGGAWQGERDLSVRILDALGWSKRYHRVRIGPGKAVGFGLLSGKPVFCLPGGPPSNHMAFLQLALPGLQALAGDPAPGLPRAAATLAERVTGQVDWTQFVHGQLSGAGAQLTFHPLKFTSRLQGLAETEAVAVIPEGCEALETGSTMTVQVLI